MTASPLVPVSTHPRRRRKSYTFFWCSLGIYSEALLFLLSGLSDACELPPPFEAMELKGTPKLYYAVGERIEYKCKKGYLHLSPYLMIATCEPNHTWVPISDVGCIKVQCIMLQNPSFGKVHYIDGRFSWGARVKFTCMEGYYLAGMSVLHCVLKSDGAYWNGHPPSCERPDKFSLVGTSMLFCADYNTCSNNPPECKGYPNPREGIVGQELDAWIVALIVIISIVGVLVICLIMLRYFEHRKKGPLSCLPHDLLLPPCQLH
ncbi:membrane cofactor protein isoform X1 [Apodemus sylvaticus]|uniref:membrane cofactor protein isoform X1 n=1 Tax=Apodemus sylvaticus TaxID=10129 RepID=UPI002242B0ED|nr:membrane cofactor protein isoform X1 [Apodemus sylvaticus]